MRGIASRLFLTILFVWLGACAGIRTIGRNHEADRITRAELLEGSFTTAYDAIQHLHPNWLHLRNDPHSVSQIVVYYDGTKYGGVNILNGIRASTLTSIERLDGPTATIRYGGGHSEGVISVVSINAP